VRGYRSLQERSRTRSSTGFIEPNLGRGARVTLRSAFCN
jgi:hypothetical protein